MSDDLGIFDQFGDDHRRPGRRGARQQRERRRREQRRRRNLLLVVGLVVAMFAVAGAAYGVNELRDAGFGKDYDGTGESDVIIEVSRGDSTSAIASTLRKQEVVASNRAFTRRADDEEKIRSIQPGFYKMKTRMSAASAVALLVEPSSRVGRLEIRAGVQLDDVQLPGGETVPGVLTRLSQSSCADLNGTSTCVPADELRRVMAETPAGVLGAPDWAVGSVSGVEAGRKLEGLIAPGNYDVRPGSSALELWQQVMTTSSLALQAAGLPDAAEGAPADLSPYQILVLASLIEREGITSDFEKVSRVIYNRLGVAMPLQLDSTINYPLDRQAIRTTADDRARPGPYNSYITPGLPPTPIGAPGKGAVAAAEEPADGPWMYFVKCQTDGTSCFNVTLPEHEAAVADAVARGIF